MVLDQSYGGKVRVLIGLLIAVTHFIGFAWFRHPDIYGSLGYSSLSPEDEDLYLGSEKSFWHQPIKSYCCKDNTFWKHISVWVFFGCKYYLDLPAAGYVIKVGITWLTLLWLELTNLRAVTRHLWGLTDDDQRPGVGKVVGDGLFRVGIFIRVSI